MINPRVLVNAVAGYSGYVTDYDAARSYARADAPPRQDLATTLNTGSAPLHQNKTRDRYPNRRQHQLLPASAHSPASTSSRPASASISTRAPTATRTTWPATASCTPIRSAVFRTRRRKSGSTTRRWFPRTTTTPTRRTEGQLAGHRTRLTINLGVRIERQHSFLPAQDYRAARATCRRCSRRIVTRRSTCRS